VSIVHEYSIISRYRSKVFSAIGGGIVTRFTGDDKRDRVFIDTNPRARLTMGYDLHITRKDFWADEEGERISPEEWQAYVNGDPEISDDPENPHEDNFLYRRDGEPWPLWFDRPQGNVYTKNPPLDVIQKMARIAQVLGAQVRGDDDERYDLDGNSHADMVASETTDADKSVNPDQRYVWYFVALVFVMSILWHGLRN
jgi:hypothetical protein